MTVIPYAGAKGGVALNQVSQMLFASDSDTYIEPFGGGFSLGLSLLEQGFKGDIVYNDLDKDIVNFWTCVRDYPEDLISCVLDNFELCRTIDRHMSSLPVINDLRLKLEQGTPVD